MTLDTNYAIARDGAPGSDVPLDTAIRRCQKLRRVLELEEWIRDSYADPVLATSCRMWQREHEQLLAELHLSN
jgi:hypothetical protein